MSPLNGKASSYTCTMVYINQHFTSVLFIAWLILYGLLYSLVLCMWSPFNSHNVKMANFAFI